MCLSWWPAPDKFRGTLAGRAAAEAIARAAAQAGWECDVAPVSDGGEGFLDGFAGLGGPVVQLACAGRWAEGARQNGCSGGTSNYPGRRWAVIESALAIGQAVVGGAEPAMTRYRRVARASAS